MTSKKPIFLITGGKGSGKTRSLEYLVGQLKAKNLSAEIKGVLSPAVFKDDERVAIDLVDLESGQRKQLAVLRNHAADGPTTQRWAFHQEALNWANQRLRRVTETSLFILDELGPLEFRQGIGFKEALAILDSGRFKLALVVVRPSLIDSARQRWPVFNIFNAADYKSPKSAGNAIQAMIDPIIQKEINMTSKAEQDDAIRLAFASDDGEKISQHFGRAQHYVVIKIEKGAIAARELRSKFSPHAEAGEHNAEGLDHDQRHALMVDSIKDCQIVIAGGMGMGAQMHFQREGLSVLMTELPSIDEACRAYLSGELKHIPDRLHQSHHH